MLYFLCLMAGAIIGALTMCAMVVAGDYDRKEELRRSKDNQESEE